MRSRCDQHAMKYFDLANQQTNLPQLLYSSSLRHHVTELNAWLYSPYESQNMKSSTAYADWFRCHPTHQQQLNWLNTLSHSMPHLKSLALKFVLSSVDTSDDGISPKSLKLPPHLLSLKVDNVIYGQPGPDERTIEVIADQEKLRFDKWILRLFSAVTSTETLCSSLRVLESMLTTRSTIGDPHSVVISTSLHKLSRLRRLALKPVQSYDVASIEAIRAIPQLCEFGGMTSNNWAYLLRAPSKQSYRQLGGSAISLRLQPSVPFATPTPSETLPNGFVNSWVDPEVLLASSGHSLIDLTSSLYIPPSFFPRFIRLRSLSVSCRQEWHFTTHPATFDAEDLVSALSQCRTLERLLIEWLIEDSQFSESHAERIVAPLNQLDYLSLTGKNHIRSLAFMTRLAHLECGLRYFVLESRLSSIAEYRVIYSLTQLRLLCLDPGLDHAREEDLLAWESESGVTASVLDAMFRPHSQVRASSYGVLGWVPGSKAPTSQKPHEYCPHLQHFIQKVFYRSDEQEWERMVTEEESECEVELLTMP